MPAAPAALLLDAPDAILLLGLIVAREMGWVTSVAVRLDKQGFEGSRPDGYGFCLRHAGDAH